MKTSRRKFLASAAALAGCGAVMPVVGRKIPNVKTWAVWLKSETCIHIQADRIEIERDLLPWPTLNFYEKESVTGQVFIDAVIHAEEIKKHDGDWYVTGNFIKLPPA